jgi:hypothetical protein
MTMENRTNGQFREDEIVIMNHWDKNQQKWVKTVYPKIGGRLRLAHDEHEVLSIATDIIKYDENLAVVRALATTGKGKFTGLGMASVERDDTIAPAILELAETRAIARSLRFAGFGVEYCSAEEISHLENGNGKPPDEGDHQSKPFEGKSKGRDGQKPDEGKGNSRITNRQLNYAVDLGKSVGWNSKDLDEESLRLFGVKMAYLTLKDASTFIESLKEKAA